MLGSHTSPPEYVAEMRSVFCFCFGLVFFEVMISVGPYILAIIIMFSIPKN